MNSKQMRARKKIRMWRRMMRRMMKMRRIGMDIRKRLNRNWRRRMSRRMMMGRSNRRRTRRNIDLNRRYRPIVGVEWAIQQVSRNWTRTG